MTVSLRPGSTALAALLIGLVFAPSPVAAQTACADLARTALPGGSVSSAQPMASFDALADVPKTTAAVAPFCRIVGSLRPTPDSDIRFEVWLPSADRWNGKFQAVGNGGFQGILNHRAMIPGLRRGYAVMTTDLGHTNVAGSTEDATWAPKHPEKVVDYAYRGEHLSTLAAKRIIVASYGRQPIHSFYCGCSAGGIQGLTELLRFPKDFDGYVIGNATPDHLGQELSALWNTLEASLKYPGEALTAAHLRLLHQAVLSQCAGRDGGLASDPFLTDPRLCRFDPAVVGCRSGQDPSMCLSPMQVAIVRRIYAGPTNPRTGERILSGITPGSELTWDRFFVGKKNPAPADRPWAGFLRDMVYEDPAYLSSQKYLGFDFDRDTAAVRSHQVGGEPLDSSWNTRNRELDAFRRAGGKVIQYHGWDDANIPALESVRLMAEIVQAEAKRGRYSPREAAEIVDGFYRLFLVPGLGHCSGGDGPWSFGQNGQAPLQADAEHDTLTALELWVEQGVKPQRFIGSRIDAKDSKVDLTRPICAFPRTARWDGRGDVANAASFACAGQGDDATRSSTGSAKRTRRS